MPAEVTYLGIRHHGPGSACRVVEALETLRPVEVLIEGPADLSDQLPLLAEPGMVPPVAQLAYPKDEPERAYFWPFADYSPEYQAVLWALRNAVAVRYIDLPVAWRLPATEEGGELVEEDAQDVEVVPQAPPERRDPIGTLAKAAGYEDGESWWRDVIEENPDPGLIFDAVGDAMAALREDEPPLGRFEAAREAHMRLEIAKSAKAQEGAIAVICGAFHVPALKAKHSAKDDRALIKGAPKANITATWAPWTSPRLALMTGYAAGVVAPGWCQHLWDHPGEDQARIWIARIARVLREDGQIVSTASLIEAERLSHALAVVRDRPQPGFEEIRDAVISVLCYGAPLLWQVVERKLLLGNDVGEVPDNVPSAPLLEDLQRQQKKARLKPEALERALRLDLRSEGGLSRSTLLHRLAILQVFWGRLSDGGRSRGTFRENWTLRWDPEFAVQLVENLVYGTTIEQAASGRLTAELSEAQTLGTLAQLVLGALTAQLPEAAAHGVQRLETRAAQTSDCREMLGALRPIADILRYGEARSTDASQLSTLFDRIATQAAIQIGYAARGLDDNAARDFAAVLSGANGAIRLAAEDPGLLTHWTDRLSELAHDDQAARLVMGAAARLLYEADALSPDDATILLGRMLSPGTPVAEASAFFEGFFDGAGQRLLYDNTLRDCVDAWLVTLDDESFTEHLPLFRRVLSALDRTEKKRLLDALFGRESAGGRVISEHADALWPDHETMLMTLLTEGSRNGG